MHIILHLTNHPSVAMVAYGTERLFCACNHGITIVATFHPAENKQNVICGASQYILTANKLRWLRRNIENRDVITTNHYKKPLGINKSHWLCSIYIIAHIFTLVNRVL